MDFYFKSFGRLMNIFDLLKKIWSSYEFYTDFLCTIKKK